ncbi:hypothetical protein DM01DRAFT_256058, partial [Hesseltinella vesiculosa]
IFFNEEFTLETAAKLQIQLDSYNLLHICYMDNPGQPMLQSKVKINGNPTCYHRYFDNKPRPMEPVEERMIRK